VEGKVEYRGVYGGGEGIFITGVYGWKEKWNIGGVYVGK
jgi:hypothetical protein